MNDFRIFSRFIFWGVWVLCLFPSTIYAQRPAFHPQTHEIGLRAVNFHSIPALSAYYSEVPFFSEGPGKVQYANGLQYKFHWDLYNVFRLTLGRREAQFSNELSDTDDNVRAINKEDIDIRLGYEGNIPMGVLTLLGGIEGVYNSQSGEIRTLSPTPDNELIDQRDFSYSAWGANAFGGIRLFFSPHVSTTLEGNVTFLDSDYETVFSDIRSDLSPSEWNVEVNLYVSVHFVKLKKRCACGG